MGVTVKSKEIEKTKCPQVLYILIADSGTETQSPVWVGGHCQLFDIIV